MGNCSSTSNCNPCGPDFNAINQLATKAGAYARQANTYSVDAQNAWLEFNALYLGAFAVAPTVDNEGDPLQVGALYWNTGSNTIFAWDGTVWVENGNFNEFTPFLATGTTFARNLVTRATDVINVKDFGAVGDYFLSDGTVNPSPTDNTIAFQNFVSVLNSSVTGQIGFVPEGAYLLDADTIVLTRDGSGIQGVGRGNAANIVPSNAPTTLVFKGAGSGIRVKGQSISLRDFAITSNSTRQPSSPVFDITSPGIRIEADDVVPNFLGPGKADRCNIDMLRITSQPGDGILLVGPTIYHNIRNCDIYVNRGFGIRFDDGSYPGIVRTNKDYHGLGCVENCRIGYNYGQAIAVSNPTVVTQAFWGLRHRFVNIDMFGNSFDTSICYGPAPDGNYYNIWFFGEEIEMNNSAPPGDYYDFNTQTAYSEVRGGIYIAGNHNSIINCRFNRTIQPIFFDKRFTQTSRGLIVDQPKILQSSTAVLHTNLVELGSIECTGVKVKFDSYDFFVNPVNPRIGADYTQNVSIYRNTILNSIGTFNSDFVSLSNDTAAKIKISQSSSGVKTFGILTIASSVTSGAGGIFHVVTGGGSGGWEVAKYAGNATTNPNPTMGPLNGTTGPSGGINISCDDDSIYIENRRGFALNINFFLSAYTTYSKIESITKLP